MYLLTLKYFACMFFFFFILSIPPLMMYSYGGHAYDHHRVGTQRLLAATTTGSLGSPQEIEASAVTLPNTRNLGAYIWAECSDHSKKISDLLHFGMAFQNFTTVGFGMNVTVRTIDRCSYGMMKDERSDQALENVF